MSCVFRPSILAAIFVLSDSMSGNYKTSPQKWENCDVKYSYATYERCEKMIGNFFKFFSKNVSFLK